MTDYAPSSDTLAAIRVAARAPAPGPISWAPEVLDALWWPALAPFMESPEHARVREFHELLMREYVQATLLLTPHASMGNVVPAGGESEPTTGTVSGPSPTPPAPGT